VAEVARELDVFAVGGLDGFQGESAQAGGAAVDDHASDQAAEGAAETGRTLSNRAAD